jgi:hypothetical protein
LELGPGGAGVVDLQGKLEREDCAAWRSVCGADGAALVPEKASCNGESEACSASAAVAGDAPRELEQVGKHIGRDAGAVVDDADERVAAIFSAGDVHSASAGRVSQRVVEDVGECAFEPVGVDRDRWASLSCHLELDASLVSCLLECCGRIDDRLREVCCVQGALPVDFRPCVVEQAGDESIDLLGLRSRSVKPLTRIAEAGCDCVEVSAQREQRCAEVVGDGADEEGRIAISAFALANGRVDEVLLLSRPLELRFHPPVRVSSAPFNPHNSTTASRGKYGTWWIGDWQGIAAGDGGFNLVWNDTRTGKLDLYAASVRP